MTLGGVICLYFIHKLPSEFFTDISRYGIFIDYVQKHLTHTVLLCDNQPQLQYLRSVSLTLPLV